jgi:hypothetical protein
MANMSGASFTQRYAQKPLYTTNRWMALPYDAVGPEMPLGMHIGNCLKHLHTTNYSTRMQLGRRCSAKNVLHDGIHIDVKILRFACE